MNLVLLSIVTFYIIIIEKIINTWNDCIYNTYFVENCKSIKYKWNYDENHINERFYG